MSFTDQKPRKATQQDMEVKWSGRSDNFRCYMCGLKFKLGDYWRWVYAGGRTFVIPITEKKSGVCNFMTCRSCDGPDVLDRWIKKHEEFYVLNNWALLREELKCLILR